MAANLIGVKEGYGFLKHNSVSETYIMAVFFIILAISGNFSAETLGCQFQRLLHNMIFKDLLIYFTIYFTIKLSEDESIHEHPLVMAQKALVVWIVFKCFTRMNIIPTISVILIGIVTVVISQYRQYLMDKNKGNDDINDEKLMFIQNVLFNSAIIIIFVSFIIYFLEKRQEYKKNFNFWTFLFGVKKCKYN